MIGDSCVANEQCTWDGHHGLCRERVCTCEEGYIAAYSGCYQGNSSWFKNIMKTCTFDTVNAVILKNFLRELISSYIKSNILSEKDVQEILNLFINGWVKEIDYGMNKCIEFLENGMQVRADVIADFLDKIWTLLIITKSNDYNK